eukprot:438457_1
MYSNEFYHTILAIAMHKSLYLIPSNSKKDKINSVSPRHSLCTAFIHTCESNIWSIPSTVFSSRGQPMCCSLAAKESKCCAFLSYYFLWFGSPSTLWPDPSSIQSMVRASWFENKQHMQTTCGKNT